MAAIGHKVVAVRPMNKFTPRRKGSVFDCLIVMHITDGDFELSTDTSLTPRSTEASYPASLGAVISPVRRKAKKPRQHAAHSIFVFHSPPDEDHTTWSCSSREGVIGRCTLRSTPCSA